MEELYNQLLTQGKIPKGVTLQDFMAVANDPQTSDALFQKLGVDKPTDKAISRNPVTGTVVDFNRGVVVNEDIKDVRANLNSAEKNFKRSKNTINSRGQEFKPQKFDLPAAKITDYGKELKVQQDRYLSSIEALGETGTDAYMKQQGPDELVEKFNELGGDGRAAYEVYDGTYRQAVEDINKGVGIIIGRLSDSHANYAEFNKEKAGFNNLSDSQKQEFSKKYQNILQDPNYESLNKLSNNYNFLNQENKDKKQLLRQQDPEYFDKIATQEEIYKNRDLLNYDIASVKTGFLARTLGRATKEIGSIATTLGADASGVYRLGKDIEGYFPNSSKAEGPAQSYNKEFDFGGSKYTAVYENKTSNTPLFYRDEEGYMVDNLPQGLEEANQSSTNERKVTLNGLPILSQTLDVLADIGLDAATGKLIAGTTIRSFKLADKGAKLAYAVGTSIPAYSRVYSQSYYEMLKDPNISADDAYVASVALSLAAAVVERFNPAESRIAQDGFDNFVTNFSRANAPRIAAGEITIKDLVKEFTVAAGKFLGGGVKEVAEEEVESAFEQNIVNPKINERNRSELKEGMSNSDIANTAVISFAAGALADLGSLNVKKSKMTLDALGAIIESPRLYEAWIDGVRATDPELADRIDGEVSPLIQEAGVYENIKDKSKLAEKLLEIRKVEKELKASKIPEVREKKKEELNKIHNEILKITDEARTMASENLDTNTVQESGGNTVTPVVEPTKEEQLQDINKGNIATFTYNNESEVPEVLKDKISSTGETNGVPFVKVTIAQNLADFLLANENINSEQSGQSLGNNATANITGDLTTEEGNVNPSSTLTNQENAQQPQETQTVQEETSTINQEAEGPVNQTNAQTGSEIVHLTDNTTESIKSNWNYEGEGDAFASNKDRRDGKSAYTIRILDGIGLGYNRAKQRGELDTESPLTYEGDKESVSAIDGNGNTIGVIKLQTDGGIEHIVVAPEFSRKGVASELIKQIEQKGAKVSPEKSKQISPDAAKLFNNLQTTTPQKVTVNNKEYTKVGENWFTTKKDGTASAIQVKSQSLLDAINDAANDTVNNKPNVTTNTTAGNEQVQGNTGGTTPSQPTESTTGQVSELTTQPTGTVTGSELGDRGQTSETVQEELSNEDNVQVLEESVEGTVEESAKQTKAQKAKEEFKDAFKDYFSEFFDGPTGPGIAWNPQEDSDKARRLLKSLVKYLRAEAVDTIEGIKDFITKQTDGKIEVNTAGATYILQVLQRPDRFGQMMQRAIAADPSIEDRIIDHERRPAVTDIEVTALAQDIADNIDSNFLEAAIDLDKVRREKETGLAEAWPVIAMAMLSKKARDFGDLQAAADIAVILDKIFTDMGGTLRLANSRLLGKYIAVVKAEMLYHQNQDRISKLDDNDQSISGNIDSVEEVPTADEVFGEIEADLDKAGEEQEGIAPEAEEAVVTPQTISNRSKAKEHLDKARKLIRKLMGQANSGIDPAMFEIGKELFLAAYYETKHRYSTIKASFKKMASDIGVPTNIIPNLFQQVINSPEFAEQQKELIVEEFKKRIDNIGKGKVIGVNKDPIQMVINQMVNAYRIRAKANEDPKAQFIKDYNNNTLKIQDVTNAIKATVTLLNLDSNQREFIKARLEDQLSTLLDKPIGKNQIRRKLNSVAAKQAVKEIIAGRFSGIQKDAFIQGIADQLISDYGFDVAEAQKYEKVVKEGVAKMLKQKSEGSEYSRAQRMYLQGLGLNKGKLQKEVEAITKELEGTMTVTERNRLTAKRKRIENILGDLENRIDNALAKGSPSIQKLIDTISSGLMTKPHIAAALSEHYKIGVLTANDLQNLQDAADRYAAAIDNRGRQEAEREITSIMHEASKNAEVKFADMATSYMFHQMLSGLDTPLKAFMSSIYNMIFKGWTEDFRKLLATAIEKPELAKKQWNFIAGGMVDGVDFLRKIGMPKIWSVYRGTELSTDITMFDYDNAEAQIDVYQAKLEKVLHAKVTPDLKGVVKAAAKFYTMLLLYGQMYYSKTVIVSDIITKSLFFPYAVKREAWYRIKDQFKGNMEEMQKEIDSIYNRDYSLLEQNYINLGYSEKEAKDRLREQQLIDDIRSHNETIQASVKAARAFTDMGAMTGIMPGIGGLMGSGLIKIQNYSKSKTFNLVFKGLTTFFPGLMGRMFEFIKDLTIFGPVGLPVNTQGNGIDWNQGIFKTVLASVTSGLNYHMTFKNGKLDELRALAPHERKRQMAKLAFAVSYTFGALAMFKWTKCSEESDELCYEPRNKNFRINGGGVRYEDKSDNWEPYTIQTRENEKAEWKTIGIPIIGDFKNNLPLQIMLAPVGYMYDKYTQKAVRETNTSIHPGLLAGLVAAPFINMWDNSFLQAVNPVTKILNFAASNKTDARASDKAWSAVQKVLARAAVTPLQLGGNLFTSINSLNEFLRKKPKQVSKYQTDSEFTNLVADRLSSNILFSGVLGEDDIDALGMKKVRDFDFALIPSPLLEVNLDDVDFLSADEKRLTRAVARYENDDRINYRTPRSQYTKQVSFNKEEPLTVISDPFTLGEVKNARNEISEDMKDFLLQRIDQVEKSDVKQFREAIDKQFDKYQGLKEGMMLVAKLSPLLVEKGYGSLEGNEQIMTESDNPNGPGKIKWADPNKIVDYMVNNNLKYEGGKIVKFNYKPYVKEE